MSEGWGTIQQPNFISDASWENSTSKSNNLQAGNWERPPPVENWGTERPSASSPSENNLSARKAVQDSWGQNKSENSWAMRNENVHVDQSSWQRKEEPPISTTYKNVKRENEEEKFDSLAIQVGIQKSFESLKNDEYERKSIVLEEDGYDPSYVQQPIKPTVAPFEEELQYNNTSDMYNVKSHVEPLISSSNPTFQGSLKKEIRSVEVQTDPIDLVAISASNEKLLSCTISSQIKKGYQQTSQDLSRSTTNSVSEKRYPQQPPSLLDVDPEEWNTKSWNTPSGNPNIREGTTDIPHTRSDSSSRGEATQRPKPNSDSWDNKPTSLQNDSRNTQRTSARNDNRGPVPQSIPVESDSWDSAPQTSTRNENRLQNTWGSTPSTRNDNRGTVPKVEPGSWDSTPSTRNDSRGTVPQPTPAEPNNWDNRGTVPKPISAEPDIASTRNDNRGTIPQPMPVVEPDSWDSAPQTTAQKAPSWNTIPQPSQDNSWGSGPQQPSASGPSDDWLKKVAEFSKELGEKNEIKTWGQTNNTEQKVDDSYGTGASDSYYNNSSSNNRYGNRGCHNCGQEDHFARDCPDKKQGSGGGRNCHKCGKGGHFARDCTEDNDRGGYGGYSSGGKACHKCGKEGHFARDCTEDNDRGGYGGYSSGGKACHKCGKEGHFARDCTEDNGGYSSGGKACHKCGKEGHFARDCREDAYEEPERSKDFNNSGLSRPHMNKPSPFSNSEHPNISSQEAWDKLLKAAEDNETDDFKEALEVYAKVSPEETFVSIEKKLRDAGSKGRIIAFERPEIPLTKILVDLQGNSNKKYVATPILVHPSRLPRTSGNRANNQEENLEWLVDSGFMVDDRSPVCFNCKQKGHITKDCTEPKREIEKATYLTCQNCNSPEHITKYCPEERHDYYAEARDRKASGGHRSEYSAIGDRASSVHDGEEDRKGYRGYGNNSNQTCYNCNREGHTSRECTEPRRGRKCNKCGEDGHMSRDCPSSSGGGYDRGNYNSSGGWQRDSSLRNNDRNATWSSQDKSGDNTWGKPRNDNYSQNNSWNKPRGDNASRDGYNQDNTWNKPKNDNYSQPRGDNSSRGDYNQDNTWNKSRNDNYSQPRGDNSSRGDYNQDNTWNKPRNDNYSQPRGDNSSRGDYNQDNTFNKPRNDNYSQPRGDNSSRGDYNQDNTWNKPKSSDNYSQPRGDNSSRGDYNQDNTFNKPRNDNYSQPRGDNSSRGDYNQDNTWNKPRNDNYSQDNSWSKSRGGNSSRGDYNQDSTTRNDSHVQDNPWNKFKIEDTTQQKDNQPDLTLHKIEVESDSWDSNPAAEKTATQNQWGSGNVTAADLGWSKPKETTTSTPENYENGRGRGNEQRDRSENYRGRGYGERTPVSENYDNRRGRGNEQRERTSAFENRRGYANEPREERYNKGPSYTNPSSTQSNDANNKSGNLDQSPWW